MINGAPPADNVWHDTAKIWQTPFLGEVSMLLATKSRIAGILQSNGVPPDIAKHEAAAFNWPMRQSILRLYRSAKQIGTEWYPGFENLPPNGLVIWGDSDPYAPIDFAKEFAAQFDLPLHILEGGGHWGFLQQMDQTVQALERHWGE